MEKNQNYFSIVTRKLVKYFFRGLLLTLPIGGTIGLVIFTFNWLDSSLEKMLGDFSSIHFPGLGIILLVVAVTLIGMFGSGLLLRPILDLVDDLLEKVPGIKVVYTAIKDFLGAFVGEKRKFNEPVAAEMSNGLYKLGFVTHKDLSHIEFEGFVAVYFPHSYNFSGNVFLVPKDKVRPINGNPSEVMKFIVTGGVTEISETKAETTNETENTFRKDTK